MTDAQMNKSLIIRTPIGPEELLLTDFRGREGISVPFFYELDMLCENHDVIFEDIIGKSVTVELALFGGESRYFNGIISRFSQKSSGMDLAESEAHLSRYTATMVPWLWLLTKTADCRIFQNMSVPDIIENIFNDAGLRDFSFRLDMNHFEKEYCVQYRETDFNFISRLMEQEGIFYFFEHEEKKHTLVMADSTHECPPSDHQEIVRYQTNAGGWQDEDVISEMEVRKEIRVGKYTVNDFNFEMPYTDLKVEVNAQENLGPGEREIYDYPAEYDMRDQGDRVAGIRMQEEEAKITTISGLSVCRDFTSGYHFELEDFYRSDMNGKRFVLTAVEHTISEPVDMGGSQPEPSYYNNFTCIPIEAPYRPPRTTPKPVVEGTQPAIVVGPSGEEIYTDKYGRVKVQFIWDREGKRDENSSCWVRVSQPWAGNSWGAIFIPRIGQEVLVDFFEGDPDRPIITGRVYDGNNMPPYELPSNMTQSTIKSNSSKGGGGFNELRFEDKKDAEEIFLHAQKDWTIAIENDKNQTVGNNETLSVGNDRTKSVGNNQSETIGTNKTIQVGSDHTETIGSNMAQTVGANLTQNVGASMAQTIGANRSSTIGAASSLTIGAAYQVTVGAAMNETIAAAKAEEIGAVKSVNVGANSSENVGADKSIDAGGNISESAGKDVILQSGKKMTLNAGDDFTISGKKKGVIELKDELTIKVGKSMINLKKNGDITLQGKNITVKGSGNITIKAKKIMEN